MTDRAATVRHTVAARDPHEPGDEMRSRNARPKRGLGVRKLGSAGATLVLSAVLLTSMVGTAEAAPASTPTVPAADHLASTNWTSRAAQSGPAGPDRVRCFAIVRGRGPVCPPAGRRHPIKPPHNPPPVNRCGAISADGHRACP